MATLDDRSGRVEVSIFPDLLAEVEDIVGKDQILVVEGGISWDDYNGGLGLRARHIERLEDWRARRARALHIDLAEQSAGIRELHRLLEPYREEASLPLVFHHRHGDYRCRLPGNGWTLKPADDCLLRLDTLIGRKAFQAGGRFLQHWFGGCYQYGEC